MTHMTAASCVEYDKSLGHAENREYSINLVRAEQ